MDPEDTVMFCLFLVLWILGPAAIFTFLYLLFFTSQYVWAMAYIVWIVYDRGCETQTRRRSEWLRNLKAWDYLKNYYPAKIFVTTPLDPARNYIFGLHPHGVVVQGGLHFGTGAFSKEFPGITPYFLIHNMFFLFPFREIMIRLGFHSVDSRNFSYLLRKPEGGNAIVVVPGGTREMLATCHGNKVELVLKTRKGFIRQAIKHGASLVPVFTFGENNLYYHYPVLPESLLARIQHWSKRLLDLPILNISGRYWLAPLRRPLYTVVGEPIHCSKMDDPSPEALDAVHQKYVEELVRIFETHKSRFGYAEQTLELI